MKYLILMMHLRWKKIFANLWKQCAKGEHKDKNEFSEEVIETFDDKKDMSNMHNNAF